MKQMREMSPNPNDRYLVPETSGAALPHQFPQGASAHPHHAPQPQSHYRRRRGIGYWLRYLFASARTLPVLTLATFLLTLLVGGIYWCSQPLLWNVDAAIIVAEPKTDEFLHYLNQTDRTSRPGSNPQLALTNRSGFRFLSPRDVGELLTTPALVQKAEIEILRLQEQTAATSSASETSPLNPTRFFTSYALDLHQRGRTLGTALLTRFTALFPNAEPSGNSNSPSSTLVINLLPPDSNGEKVLRLQIAASQPELAEAAAEMLVEMARNRLSEFESGSALTHLNDQQPRVEAAQAKYAQTRRTLTDFKNTLTLEDPAALVATLTRRLADSDSQRAQLEIATTEAETEHLSVGRQLETIRANGDAFVFRNVTADNPRIVEVNREISILKGRYDALVDYTDRHPEKLALKKQIERKQAEFDALPASIIIEEVREPNPVFTQLVERRLELDRTISQLAGRAAGLKREDRSIRKQLEQSRGDAERLTALQDVHKSAEDTYNQLAEQYEQLITSIAQSQQFQHIQVMETPTVRSRMLPDSPQTLKIMGFTLLAATGLALFIPMLCAAWRARAVSRSQIEILANELPIVIVGELPRRPTRKLLAARITSKTPVATAGKS